jgi:hypothetical protein
MATCQTRNLTISLLVALLPMNAVLAGGRGGGPQGAVGSGLSGSSGYGAAVGGGAPAGAVGGGPPAGLIGGGIAPTNTNPATSGSGAGQAVGGVPGAYTGIPSAPDTPAGGLPPGNPGSAEGSAEKGRAQSPVGPKSVEGVAAAPDAISPRIVAPRPCAVAAHETDGFTTCIGILPSGHGRSGRARVHTGDMRHHVHVARS